MTNTNKNTPESGAETRKYLVVTGSNWDAKDRWYTSCRRAKIPWVVVTKKQKLADIDVDLFTMANELDEVIRLKRTLLTAGYRELYRRYATKKSVCYPGHSGPGFQGIPIDVAEEFAEELLCFVNETVRVDSPTPSD